MMTDYDIYDEVTDRIVGAIEKNTKQLKRIADALEFFVEDRVDAVK